MTSQLTRDKILSQSLRALLGSALVLAATTSYAARYKVTILDKIPGGTSTLAYAINNVGQVAGKAADTGACSHGCATRWDGARPQVLGNLPASLASWAQGINDAGQVVGAVVLNNGNPIEAVVWNGGTPAVLKTVAGSFSEFNFAAAINDAGQIAGNSDSGHGQQAVVWNGITPTSLAAPCSAANGINRRGQVVGSMDTCLAGASVDAVLWSGTTATTLATLGGSYDVAVSLNDSDRIVGYAATKSGAQHAVAWRHNIVSDLGTLGGSSSSAAGINAEGRIVGSADIKTDVPHAALWLRARSTPIDLNEEIGPRDSARITLTEAVGINDRCDIVANGYDNKTGIMESFILSMNDRSNCEWNAQDDDE